MSESREPILVLQDSDEKVDTLHEVAEKFAKQWLLRRAPTGDDSCECYRRMSMARHPLTTIVLKDSNVPGTDGLQTLAAMRQQERLRRLPVVVLSTSKNPAEVAYCYGHGANADHVKPVHDAAYLHVLDRILTCRLTAANLPCRGQGWS